MDFCLGIFILVIIGAIGSGGGNSQDANSNTETSSVATTSKEDTKDTTKQEEKAQEEVQEEAIAVSAYELYKQYDANEVKADRAYKDKVLEITGEVTDIGVSLNQTYVCLSTGEYSMFSVQCFFKEDSEIDKVSNLNNGDTVTITGTCDGMSLNIGVNDCKLK